MRGGHVRFAVLGPLEATNGRRVDPDRPAQRRLLAVLLFHAGTPLETDVLIDRFWGEAVPRTAKAALQTHLSALRRRLGADLIATTSSGYRLDLGDHELDRETFDRIADAARDAHERGAWEAAADLAAQALAIWRGPPYADLVDDEFAWPEISRLEERRGALIELRAEALLALGRGEVALPDLEAAAAEHPLRERLCELIMLARTRAGRPTEALEAYQQLRSTLAEMGLEPSPALRDLEERILREDPTLVPSRVRHNLPSLTTSFVGRHVEIGELSRLVSEHRVVTVTGVGGTGKTRLSVEVARRLLGRFPDGVYLVELGGLTDPDLVVTELAATLGFRTERQPTLDAVSDALRHRSVLVVLDNCEHLIDACAEVAAAIGERGPGATVLATSREAFGLAAERVFEVPPLETPPEEVTDVVALSDYDAVRLFADRAVHAASQFALEPATLPAVATICRQLDGLPLAIELAAARMRSLSAATIASHLDDRFRLLARGRHGAPLRQQTLEAAIDWSYQLLDERERALFRRLSVFRAGFDLEAAEEICSDDAVPRTEVAELLGRLADQSLLGRDRSGDDVRYRLLETLRHFARQRLEVDDSVDELLRRHLAWYLAIAEAADIHLEDAEQPGWLDRLGADRENLDAALEYSVTLGERRAVSRLAEALGWYHARLGQYARAVAEMRAAIDHLDPSADPERAAAVHVRLAGTLYGSGDEADALTQARLACDLLAERGPSQAKVRALSELASLHLRIVQQDPQPAIDASREAVAVASAIGDRYAESHALRTLGTALCWAGAVDEGIAHLRRALATAIAIDNPPAILGVYMRLYISLVDFARDDDEAARTADEALAWLDAGGGRWGQSTNLLMWFAYGSMRGGRWRRAEEMLDRSGEYHIEGMSLMSYRSLRGMLRWMQGRLTEAQTEIGQLRATDPRPRYFRLLYPLEAEVAADEGRLDDVRRLAEAHLDAQVIPAEETTKVGTLRALVRAEIDAAEANPSARHDHLARARRAMVRIRRLVTNHPTDALSGLQLERPRTYLALAEAELARGTEAGPNAWRAMIDQPLFAYWRLYARWRLGESLLAIGRHDEGTAELRAARAYTDEVGAYLLRGRIDATARRTGVNLGAPVTEPRRDDRTPGRDHIAP
jgi:predicted ATPase/DNA-binding SARP family transcriptional activator